MASGRILKTQISFSEQVNDLSIYSALLFTWMIPHADDFGRMHGNARKVKALVVPMRDDFTSIKVEECLVEISKAQLIDRYRFDGEFYIQFPAWEEHQSGLHKRTKSKLPEPPEKNLIPGNSGKFRTELELELELEQEEKNMSAEAVHDEKPIEKVSVKEKKPKPKKNEYTTEFEIAFSSYPERDGDNPKNKAFGAWKARLREGTTAEEMTAGINRYKKYCDDTATTGTAWVKHMATFLGTDRFYKNLWTQKSPNPAANRGSGFGKQPAQRPDYSNLGKPEKEPDFIDSTAMRIN